MAWGISNMAKSLAVPQEDIFKSYSSGLGETFSLVPEQRSSVPLQWAHFGPGAIPNVLTDVPCSTMDAEKLLLMLNNVLGTSYGLDKPGLRQCLEHFLRASHDFGQVYSSLRPYWRKQKFAQLVPDHIKQREKDEQGRKDALLGDYIRNPHIHPRRVWDLYSNRVVPFYVLPPLPQGENPTNIWTVSHSWVREEARANVWTSINGNEWPVPLPNDTTLEHVRIELLNLGAEYVWLDVLCLRQRHQENRT